MLDVAFRPDPARAEPLYRQLADHLAELIAAGRLRRGERMPPTRELAASLGLSRNTVTRAYEWLVDAGYFAAHVGRGTFVARAATLARDAARAPEPTPAFAWPALLSASARTLRLPRAVQPGDGATPRFDFRPGHVDPDSLPIAELQGAWQRALARLREHANDLDPFGHERLRAGIARSLAGRGIARSADEVIVTAGAQQALDLVARALLEPGDPVAMEDPGYHLAALAFRGAGARVIGVGVDAEGLRVDELARVLRTRRPKLVYTTPSVQLPTGVTLSPERRATLLELADQAQMPIVEDDYDCELRLSGPAAPALKTLDRGDRVIYVGTFSKALFPGLRLGYVVGAPALLAALARGRIVASMQPSMIDQLALAALLETDTLERHVRRVRKRYAERCRVMTEALATEMPAGTRVRPPAGGSAIWVSLPAGVDTDALAAAAAARGIAYTPDGVFRIEAGGGPALSLSFGALAPEAIREGVAELGALVRRQGERRVRTPRSARDARRLR